MYQISLINMPFSLVEMPSLALTQLRSVLEEQLGDKVRVRILYLNHEFARYLGDQPYRSLININNGLGEWLFRQAAFPDQPDNSKEYLRRHRSALYQDQAATQGRVLAKRKGFERLLSQILAKYKLDEEDLVGFTSMFFQNVPSIAMARLIKERNPSVITVMGGANCEAPMGKELVRHADPIDFVFSGPGLISFPRFIGHLLDGEPQKCHQIRGVLSRGNLQLELLDGCGSLGEELPLDVPVPLDYDSFFADLDRNFPQADFEAHLPFETSRGCWWGEKAHCTFCGLNGSTMAYRAMPPQMALEMIESLIKRYSHRCKRFESVDNILPREYLKDLFPRLSPPPHVELFYEVKADLSDEELRVLSQARVKELQPGIESLNTSTLKLMKKGTTAFRNIALLKNCARHSIEVVWNLLVGFPGESEDVYRKYLADVALMSHLPPPGSPIPVSYNRYSPYHTQAKEYGLDLAPFEIYGLVYPFGEKSLMNMAYFFIDRNASPQHLARLETWRERLNGAVSHWRKRWSGQDGLAKARLRLQRRGDSFSICDTRSGELAECPIDEQAFQLLCLIDQRGRKVPDMARQLGCDEAALLGEIEQMQGRGWLFEEEGRYISLVELGEQRPALHEALFGALLQDASNPAPRPACGA